MGVGELNLSCRLTPCSSTPVIVNSFSPTHFQGFPSLLVIFLIPKRMYQSQAGQVSAGSAMFQAEDEENLFIIYPFT